MTLTREDLDVLIEATEAWESKDSFGDLFEGVLTAMIGPREDGPEREAWLRKQEALRADKNVAAEQAKRVRKERSIILRAKLIQMRDSVEADNFATAARA